MFLEKGFRRFILPVEILIADDVLCGAKDFVLGLRS